MYRDGDWLKARGTTLGADDGIGVAICLALLSEQDVEHGPLECLLTADEETTMGGAENIDPNLLNSNFLINLDSEDGNICVGCAGGFEVDLDLPVSREAGHAGDTVLYVAISYSWFTKIGIIFFGITWRPLWSGYS